MKRDRRGARENTRVPKGLQAGRIKTPALVAPIAYLEDDYRAIKKAPMRKMSNITLKYMKDKKAISGDQYAIYKTSQEKPEDRELIVLKNIVEHINLKLLELYEKA